MIDFSKIFEAMPGYNALVRANAPLYTILAVTDDFLSNSGKTKQQLIGRNIFEVFPSNPNDSNDTGEKSLLSSFEHVIKFKEAHQLAAQRYDVPDENGNFTKRYWVAKNKPVINDQGEVSYIIHTAEEITSQVKAKEREDTIKDLEETFKLFNQAPVALSLLKGNDFIIELANEKMLDLYGDGKEILHRPIVEVRPELKDQGYLDLLRGVINTGKSYYGYESPFTIISNGLKKIIYYNFVYQPYYENDQATPTGILVFANEVTDRITVKNDLRESEQRVRSIVDSAPFPIGVYIGKEMKIALANQSIIDVWGKGNDVINKLYSEILPELHNQQIFSQLNDVYNTGIPFHAKNQRVDIVINEKLQAYYFNYSFTPLFNSTGDVYGVMNTAADVTDLNIAKQKIEASEAQLRNLVMSAPIGICIVRGNPLEVEIVNDSFLEVMGKTREAFEGSPYLDVFQQSAPFYSPILENVLKTGSMFRGDDHELILMRNGKKETICVNFVYDPVKDESGNITKVMIVVIEVTEQVTARRKIEEVVTERTKELAEANNNLRRSNDELAQFAYIASHDLQEPLRKVSTFSQLLEQSLPIINERSKNYLDKINNSTSRMATLIHDVLAYSQLSKESEIFEKVNLLEVIEGIQNDFELLIEQKKATIHSINLPEIQAIPLQMSQLFGNLMSNALKFSSSQMAPTISITGRQMTKKEIETIGLDTNLVYFDIEFKDNGIGFNQEHAGRIFHIFQRLHGKNQYSGTGIGLAMCKKIVQNHNGEIYASANLDEGAVFNVVLPERQVRPS